MRSKEVSEAIKMLGNIKLKVIYDLTGDEKRCFDKVLNYIEELENMIPTPSNEVPVEYQTDIWVNKRDAVMKSEIRDKIKELDDEFHKCEYVNDKFFKLGYQRDILKSIIGE